MRYRELFGGFAKQEWMAYPREKFPEENDLQVAGFLKKC